jgi:predicted acylesterase/phospholipase RssA
LQANNIKIDVVADTSIGGVNAAIIAGGKQEGHPEKVLEQYWLELADGSTTSNSCSNGNLSFPQYTPLLHSTGRNKSNTYFPSKINPVFLWLSTW